LQEELSKELRNKQKSEARRNSSKDPTVAYFLEDRDGIWSRASKYISTSRKFPHLKRFLFELMTNSLPTIAQQYNLNEVKFPALYPDKYCKCCTTRNAENVFHALCICPGTAEARENAFDIMAEHLHRKIDNLSVDGRSLQSFFCSPDNFQRGLIVKNVFSVLVDASLGVSWT
jgi:hypothetical protein